MSQKSSAQAASSSSRRITSVRQLELLVDFMERHKDLALGRVHSKEARALAQRLWNECAVICNAEGTYRKPKEWGRYWNDFKGRVKTKLRTISQSVGGTGGGPPTDIALSPIEDRVAAILGRDVVAPLQGVQQNPFLSQNTAADESSHPQQPHEVLSYMGDIEIEYEQDMMEQIPVSELPVSEQIYNTITEHEPQDSAPRRESTQGSRPHRSEHRPRVHARPRSLLTQQVEDSLNESRAAFVRLEEAKIAAQAKQIDIENKKVEALQQIALAISKLADAVSSTYDPASSTLQHGRHIRTRLRRISSSDESDSL